MARRDRDPQAVLFDTLSPMLPTIRKRLAQRDVAGLARILGSHRSLLTLVTSALETRAPAELDVPNDALATLRKAAAAVQLGPVPPTREPERSTARISGVPAAAR